MNKETNNISTSSKILFEYKSSTDNSVLSRSSRADGSIVDSDTYIYHLSDKHDSEDYKTVAGTDISSILYPFSTKVRRTEDVFMPCFESGVISSPNFKLPSGTISISHISSSGGPINLSNLLPYMWQNVPSGSSVLNNVYAAGASGDAMSSTVRSEIYRGNFDRFRDDSDIRSVGMRLPMMGVGWGYGSKHGDPYPSGSNNSVFAGNVQQGYRVNPDNYVAAPIDLRYDEDRHVWAAPKGFWAELTSYISNSGLITYSWKEKYQVPTASGIVLRDHPSRRSGGFFDNPAYESSNSLIPSGSIVWIPPRERTDSYFFNIEAKSKDFFAIITGNSIVPGHDGIRWYYQWSERYLGASGQLTSFPPSPRSGQYAININELANQPEPSGANQPWYLCGIDAHGPTFPSGFALRPIGGGGLNNDHKSQIVVQMHQSIDNLGKTYYWFDKANTFDGMA
jgi:hypothetical protein